MRMLVAFLALAGCATPGFDPDDSSTESEVAPVSTTPNVAIDSGSAVSTPSSPVAVVDSGASSSSDAGAKDGASGDASDASPAEAATAITVDVLIDSDSDCVTVSCPASAPFPIGCAITMKGGDDEGCAASTPTGSSVFFKEGDHCGGDDISGKLICSSVKGVGLTAANCTIDRDQKFFVDDMAKCPD